MHPTPLTVVALVRARPGQETALERELLALIAPTRAEPGCLNYDLHRSAADPACFCFHENWRTKADLEAHFATPHFTTILARAQPLFAEPPQILQFYKIG